MLDLYANHGVGETNGGNAWFDGGSDIAPRMRYWLGTGARRGWSIRALLELLQRHGLAR